MKLCLLLRFDPVIRSAVSARRQKHAKFVAISARSQRLISRALDFGPPSFIGDCGDLEKWARLAGVVVPERAREEGERERERDGRFAL